jgi:hypothetical protein
MLKKAAQNWTLTFIDFFGLELNTILNISDVSETISAVEKNHTHSLSDPL